MLSCPAEGCKFTTKSDRALTVHVGKCKKAAIGLASIADEVERREADHREAKRRRISLLERLEVLPEVEEPMDVDLEVCIMDDESESKYLMNILSGHQPAWRLTSSSGRTSTPY
jgi:hypothetical protein